MKVIVFTALLTMSNALFGSDVNSLSISELKQEILDIAAANTERLDNFKEVRGKLDPLVKALKAKGDQSVQERVEGKIGSWQQLWTDDSDDTRPNNFFSQIDRSRTFQVVDPNGFFYNVSEMKTAIKLRLTVFLRGTYAKQGEGISIKFTNIDIKALGTKDITDTTYKLENKEEKFFAATRFSEYPNGPVGAEGYIDTVYVDDEMRVDYGYNTADEVIDLFVLKRMEGR
ncbi:MAG: hypothetical protein CMP10_01620 [Zetaproteobacteria bacterium]|nr:hypothetical protein [Pseudobdellovibrionaceae bacterium]